MYILLLRQFIVVHMPYSRSGFFKEYPVEAHFPHYHSCFTFRRGHGYGAMSYGSYGGSQGYGSGMLLKYLLQI